MNTFLLPRVFSAVSGLALLSGVITMSTLAQAAPSFDCAKATTEVEKTVCASPDLAQADRALADAYKAVLARAPEEAKALLRADQRAWIAHVGKTCQARWAPPSGFSGYAKDCIESAYRGQTEFYSGSALTLLPGSGGVLLGRQVYRSVPVAAADIVEHAPKIRVESYRYPQFLAPALKPLAADKLPEPDAESFETTSDFKATVTGDRLLSLERITYTYQGGAHGTYGSTFETIDLAAARPLTMADIFRPNTPWRAVLARETDTLLRAAAKAEEWPYEPLTVAEQTKAVADPARWALTKSFGVYFGIYEVGPYAAGAHVVPVPYSAVAEFLTPEFKKLIDGVK